MTLAELGWNERFAAAYAEHDAAGRVPGRIVLEHTHIYRVATEDAEMLARVSGRLRHRAEARPDFPGVGDWVVVEPVDASDARIHTGFHDSASFPAAPPGTTEEQIAPQNRLVFLVGGLDGDSSATRSVNLVAWRVAHAGHSLEQGRPLWTTRRQVEEVGASAHGGDVPRSRESSRKSRELRAHSGGQNGGVSDRRAWQSPS